jgi:serine/threonine protein kinase
MGAICSSNRVVAEKRFLDLYILENTILGKGGFAIVSLGKTKSSGEEVAIKIVDHVGSSAAAEQALLQEWDIMKSLSCPTIIQAKGFFDEERFSCLVLEYVGGGDLFERVIQKESYSEGDAWGLTRTLLQTLKYLHDRNIVHRYYWMLRLN